MLISYSTLPTEGNRMTLKMHTRKKNRSEIDKWKFSYEISIEDLIYFAINFFLIYIYIIYIMNLIK